MQETAAGREGRWVVLVVKDFSFRQQNDDDRRFNIMVATIGINLKGEAYCPVVCSQIMTFRLIVIHFLNGHLD